MALSHRFSALGRSFEARVRPTGEGPGALWVADVFEGEAQKMSMPLGHDLDALPDEQRRQVLARLEGLIEHQCRHGLI